MTPRADLRPRRAKTGWLAAATSLVLTLAFYPIAGHALTPPGPPTQPGAIVTSSITHNSVTMTWGPSHDTLGVEGYQITRQVAGASGPAPAIAVTDGGVTHYTAQALYAGTQYVFGVIAIDTAGQTSAPQTTTMTTSAFPASPAPLPPADNSVAAHPFSDTRIDVVWAGSPSPDISGYQVLRDGAPLPGGRLDLPGGLHYSDNTVSAGSQHSYAIEAIDSGGQVSAPTAVKPPATATALATGTEQIARGPYLSDVSGTSAVLSWWTNIPTTGVVHYGIASVAEHSQADSATTQHHAVTLTGLTPGAAYRYTVGDGTLVSVLAGFRTAAPAGTAFAFAAIGDFGGASLGELQNAANIAAGGTSFIQTAGDNIYASAGNPEPDFSTVYSDYDARFFKQFAAAVRSQSLFPANGNQEYYSNGKFWSTFPMPGSNHSWYSYDWGNAHFLVLDSEVAFDPASPQYAFAQADLAAHQGATFRIVAVQRPAYSSATATSGSTFVRASLVPLFEKYHVALVLSGNSHNYERSFPLIGGTPTAGGVTYVVTGGGGNGHNAFTLAQPAWSAARDATHYEYTRVSVSPAALTIRELDAATNSTLDSATINAPQPVAPRLNGPVLQAVRLLTVVPISGTAPPGSTVGIFFHRRGQVGYTQRRSLVVGADGRFSTSYVAVDAMRYYAAIGSAASASVLTMIRPVVNGPTFNPVKAYTLYYITGSCIPATTITMHFHRPGGAANDYSILRRVTVGSNGLWEKAVFPAAGDLAFYVTSDVEPVTLTSGVHVLQAR
ncbi:MAG TPA: fibronectin type III domain-containing protein [Jatrophihabitans sp.]|nr:fibronectin type III domain-containing protein [Jatrophihabitans sp.]